jgi:hypothetical protein
MKYNYDNIIGVRYGKSVVISFAPKKSNGAFRFLCKCDCGNIFNVLGFLLITGKKDRCKKCVVSANRNNFGLTKTKEYISWAKMRERCKEVDTEKSKYYKEKGVSVCDRWNGVDGFKLFLQDVGYAPSPKHTIDRYPNKNGNYEPSNVRWATHAEQCRNRNSNVVLEYNGQSKTATEWEIEYGLNRTIILQRIKRGWTVEAAITTPAKNKKIKLA